MQTELVAGRRRNILLLIFSILSIVGLAGRGIYAALVGLSSTGLNSPTELSSSLFDATSMLLLAALLLPLFIYCILRLKQQEIRPIKLPPVKFWLVTGLLAAWVLMLIIGSILEAQPKYGGLMALPFFTLGIALPVAVLVWIAIGGLPIASRQRLWAALSIGMVGSTILALLLELLFLGVGVLAAGIVLAFNPDWLAIFQQIRNQLANGGDIQAILPTLAPYLTNPLVLLLALLFASVIAPIIEETLKPAAVWLIGRRLRSTGEGFALGALGGAGFALLEGTLAAQGNLQMLGVGIAARAASSLLHITVSGLMGWGIASALVKKNYARLAGTYLLAITIHGLWNGSVILTLFGSLKVSLATASTNMAGMLIVVAGIGILGLMLITTMLLLLILNHRLRPNPPITDNPKQNDIIAPLQP